MKYTNSKRYSLFLVVVVFVFMLLTACSSSKETTVANKTPNESKKIAKNYYHGVPWEKEFSVTQAHSINGTIYISGQFSHDMKGEFVGKGDIKAQTRQTFENLDRVLAGYGVTKSNLAELEIYLTRPQEDFEPFVELFKEYVGDNRPAVTLIGVSGLAFPEQLVEIRAVAHTD